ncbi:MAG TPA: MFS transporter [Rhodobacter sp.]|nr:MFS transporter [Rhodobacter sp.]
MFAVLTTSWPLLLGVMLLMVGNGMQGSLLGIRGAIEGFSTFELSLVMSAYFLGFLGGSRMTPDLIRRVGHVRVFAALASLISASLVIYPVLPNWFAWTLLRVCIGFSFSGVYVTAESWLNNQSTNETRGQTLSFYMIVQMLGIIMSQALLNVADPSDFTLFVIPSVLVSLAFIPILLTASTAPVFESAKSMKFKELFIASPLGCVGMFVTGGIFSALFGMASVWGTEAGLSVRDISIFIASIYVGGLLMQYPIGRASDRMDRRIMVTALALLGFLIAFVVFVFKVPFVGFLAVGFLLGGITNPLYSLLIAHTNDFLDTEQMASASSGMIFINGTAAIFGPLITGWMIEAFGPNGFFAFIGLLMGALAIYAFWRMTRRAAPVDAGAFPTFTPQATAMAVGLVIEQASEQSDE